MSSETNATAGSRGATAGSGRTRSKDSMISVVSTSQLPSAHSTCGTCTTPVCRAQRRMFACENGSSR